MGKRMQFYRGFDAAGVKADDVATPHRAFRPAN
jgi:hypothetical protein